MGQVVIRSSAFAQANFSRYVGANVTTAVGDTVIALVFMDAANASAVAASCKIGGTVGFSGGTAMTAIGDTLYYDPPTNSLFFMRAFKAENYSAAGSIFVEGDVTYTDRKPLILALSANDPAGVCTVSSVLMEHTTGTTMSRSATTIANDLLVFLGHLDATSAPVEVAGTTEVVSTATGIGETWETILSKVGSSGTTTLGTSSPGSGSNGHSGITVVIRAQTGAGTAPNITTHPVSQSVTVPTAVTFSVSATGSGTLTYQWQRNGSNISGATSANYTTPATTVSGGTANNGDTFRCVVTGDTSPPATSNSATLTVTAAGTAPSISSHPSNQTVSTPTPATFTVAATGSGTLTYQWQRNGSDIFGAVSTSYTTPATTVAGGSANSGDTYRCVVTGDTSPPATSNSATLTVNTGGSYGFTAGPCYLNTGSGKQVNKAVSYSLIFGGSAGSYAGRTIVDGSGTLASVTGILTVTGLTTAGAAELRMRDADGGEYVQQVTVA